MLRRRRLESKDNEGFHPRRGRLSPLPDRQPEHLFGLYVGLARTNAAANAMNRAGVNYWSICILLSRITWLQRAISLLNIVFAAATDCSAFGYASTSVDAQILSRAGSATTV